MSFELVNSNQSVNNNEDIFSNIEAELALIGCILWDNRNYEKVSDFIYEFNYCLFSGIIRKFSNI